MIRIMSTVDMIFRVNANVSTIEILWVIVALIGLLFASALATEAHTEISGARRAMTNGILLVLAKGRMRREALRVVKQSMFLAAGALAMTRPTVNFNLAVLAIQLFIFLPATIMALQSYLDWRENRVLDRMIRERADEDHD